MVFKNGVKYFHRKKRQPDFSGKNNAQHFLKNHELLFVNYIKVTRFSKKHNPLSPPPHRFFFSKEK